MCIYTSTAFAGNNKGMLIGQMESFFSVNALTNISIATEHHSSLVYSKNMKVCARTHTHIHTRTHTQKQLESVPLRTSYSEVLIIVLCKISRKLVFCPNIYKGVVLEYLSHRYCHRCFFTVCCLKFVLFIFLCHSQDEGAVLIFKGQSVSVREFTLLWALFAESEFKLSLSVSPVEKNVFRFVWYENS